MGSFCTATFAITMSQMPHAGTVQTDARKHSPALPLAGGLDETMHCGCSAGAVVAVALPGEPLPMPQACSSGQ